MVLKKEHFFSHNLIYLLSRYAYTEVRTDILCINDNIQYAANLVKAEIDNVNSQMCNMSSRKIMREKIDENI